MWIRVWVWIWIWEWGWEWGEFGRVDAEEDIVCGVAGVFGEDEGVVLFSIVQEERQIQTFESREWEWEWEREWEWTFEAAFV